MALETRGILVRSYRLPTVVLAIVLALSTACSSGGGSKAPPPAPNGMGVPGDQPTETKKAPPVEMPTGPAAHFSTARTTSAGPIKVTTFKGPKSGVTGKVWVWLPPEYNQPKYAKSGFPVLMLYTGNTGVNYNFWPDPRVVPTQADAVSLTKSGKAKPFIMVMPILQLSERDDTECSDRAGQPKMATWMADDLVTLVRQNFRTLPGRDGFGTMGASSGAFCAIKLAMQFPQVFKAAVSWCGYFDPEPTGAVWSRKDMQDNSPTHMAAAAPDVKLYLVSGTNPKWRADYERIYAFKKVVKAPTVVDTYFQQGGGHLTDDMKRLVPNMLEWLSKNLEGPVASS
jgi:enterochelin esterase-like enzyme